MVFNGCDTAWPQGGSSGVGSFNITCATRANVGLQVDDGYHARVDATLGRGAEKGDYHFNDASVNPSQQADFFWHNLYRYAPGQMLALDVEYETRNGKTVTYAMNPQQAGEFFDYLHSKGVPYSGMACYINRSIRKQWDWSPVWNRGIRKWITTLDNTDPGDWDIWQYLIIDGIDRNWSKQSLKDFYYTGQSIQSTVRKTEVFRFSYKGWFGIAVPSGNPAKPLHAIVLGGQDNSDTMPYVAYQWQNSYAQLFDMLDNPSNCPAP